MRCIRFSSEKTGVTLAWPGRGRGGRGRGRVVSRCVVGREHLFAVDDSLSVTVTAGC
jgi:hypothetical protein